MKEHLINDRLKLVTVRIVSINKKEWIDNGLIYDSLGSGVLVNKLKSIKIGEPNLYAVLTANHVINKFKKNVDSTVYIQTHDDLLTEAKIYDRQENINPKLDLNQLYFYSYKSYQTIPKARKMPSLNTTVYVSGFPCNINLPANICSHNLYIASGILRKITDPINDEGYSLGYNNKTEVGMSGGPVLNSDGELIGIHGRGKTQESEGLSWAIPVLGYSAKVSTPELSESKLNNTLILIEQSPQIQVPNSYKDTFTASFIFISFILSLMLIVLITMCYMIFEFINGRNVITSNEGTNDSSEDTVEDTQPMN